MTHGGTEEERAARDGWRLVQIARLAIDVEALAHGLRELLAAFDPDELQAIDGAVLDPDRRDAVLNDACALRDVAEQVGMIGGDFAPHNDPLSVPLEALGEIAAEVLAEGSANASMIQLAARLVHRKEGFVALAEGLDTDPIGHASQWGDVTIGDVLGAFRDGSDSATSWICEAARVSAHTPWASLESDALILVTGALRNAPL
jgi:hypothetical protein